MKTGFLPQALCENDLSIGGEQSGHTIVRKYASTGDGILTAILLTECVVENKSTLGALAAPVKMYPQVLKNIRVESKAAVMENKEVLAAVKDVEKALGNSGRILLRESGTEPLIRVMVESPSQKTCEAHTDSIIALIKKLGLAE